jgi:endonuclease/exonuclease/phosphatase family metal-dependent hydrolase
MRARTIVLVVVVLAACGDDGEKLADGPSAFRVMTQNLYLGADLDFLAAVPALLPVAVEEVWASVQATDFPSRAKLVAATIQSASPDIVGLQEVSLWRRQDPSDFSTAPVPNATEVVYDFLALLQSELTARGLAYTAVAISTNADIELPGASGKDYRLTDRDVILVKTALPVVAAASGTYPPADLAVVAGTSLPILRGWTSVDFRAGGKTMRLVNTHLEAISTTAAGKQAVDVVGIAQTTQQPTILSGDMNLTPGSPGYGSFVTPGTGLVDAGNEVAGGTALTCCWDPLLTSGAFSTRIDLVFHSAGVQPTSFQVVNQTETTASGLHASDHAGVVVGFTAM